jgi:hypothetical protein
LKGEERRNAFDPRKQPRSSSLILIMSLPLVNEREGPKSTRLSNAETVGEM